MDIDKKLQILSEQSERHDISEGILRDIQGALNYYVDGITAMEDVSKAVKALAAQAQRQAVGKTDDEKKKIVSDFMIRAKAVVTKSKIHNSMKAGYLDSLKKSFGKKR